MRYSEWDFVLKRDDGTFVLLHPTYSDTKISAKEYWPTEVWGEDLPATGPGGTSGHGTFDHFKTKHIQRELRFDAKKLLLKDRAPQQYVVPRPQEPQRPQGPADPPTDGDPRNQATVQFASQWQ